MQERRLHKMGSRLQHANSPLQSRKKRSFSLPSFRRSSASAGDQRQEVVPSAEEAARIQKAAAWQWYTRGVGDALLVLPTKRPLVGKSPPPASQAPMDDKMFVDRISKGGESIITEKNNVLQKKLPQLEPPLAQPPRAASPFKSEACFAKVPTLYDEFELSGLRSQMADFVQRLQQHQTKDNEQTSPAVVDHQKVKLLNRVDVDGPAVVDHQKAKSLHRADVDGGSLLAAAASGLNADQPPPSAAAAAMANYHQLTKLPPASAAPVPFRMRPFFALHRLFRKVVSGSIRKKTTNSPIMIISSPEVYETKVLLPVEEEELNSQYHYHHYIHYHHHHYHYGQSPEESSGAIIRSRRRHSESSGIGPLIPSSWEAELSDEEDQASPIEAYLTRRRRRHSDRFGHSFAEHLTPAAFDEEQEMTGKSVKAALPLQLRRRYNSESFSPNKMPTMKRKELAQPAAEGGEDEFDEGHMNIKIRRHSAENNREGGAMERKEDGARIKSRTYTLSGAPDSATAAKTLVRRRHSEVLQRPQGVQYDQMGKLTPSPAGKPYWHSPSVKDRQIGASAATAAAPARRPPRPPRDLPPSIPCN